MYKQNNIANINAPLLFRLTDDDPHLETETRPKVFVSLDNLMSDIKSNLESILNTRRKLHLTDDTLIKTPLAYGIADYRQPLYRNVQKQQQLCREIERAIQCFEPRVLHPQVSLIKSDQEVERIIRLRIDATIHLHPKTVPAVFESCLDVANALFKVE